MVAQLVEQLTFVPKFEAFNPTAIGPKRKLGKRKTAQTPKKYDDIKDVFKICPKYWYNWLTNDNWS